MSGGDLLNPAPARVRLTYDDFVLLPDDGQRHELIDGAHYVTPSPNTRHQAILWQLTLMMGAYLEAHPTGRAFFAPLDVVLSDVDVVEPDFLYMSHTRAAEVLTAKHVTGVPELVVEVGSPATRQRDETIKRRLYERAGVAEYWFIDPDVDVVRVYRRAGNAFAPAVELLREHSDILTTTLLPGLELPLARIFQD